MGKRVVSGRSQRQGKNFETETKKALADFASKHTVWYRRIPDFREWVAHNDKLQHPRVPGDFEALYKGRFFMLEAKSTIAPRYNMSYLKDHQKQSLVDIETSGGYGFILFSHRGHPTRVCAIRIHDYLELESVYHHLNQKSIVTQDILDRGIELPRMSGYYDISPLFDYEEPIVINTIRGIKIYKKEPEN